MSIKYVVFDWDGTLADTYPVISAAYDYTFDTLGLPRIPYDEIKRITSTLQNKDTLGYIFGERKDEAAKAYYDFIGKNHATNLQAIPGAKYLLEYCQKNNIFRALITNKKTRYVAEEIEHLGFSGMFDKIIAAGEYAEDKPHPLATHAVFNGEVPPASQIMVLGDGEADYKVARTYDHGGWNAKCVIYDPHGKYQGSIVDYKVTALRDVVTILEKLNTKCQKTN